MLESRHEIIKLPFDAELHRFINPAGVPYSAIYVDGEEIYNHVREREEDMVNYYISTHIGDDTIPKWYDSLNLSQQLSFIADAARQELDGDHKNVDDYLGMVAITLSIASNRARVLEEKVEGE